MQPGELLWTPGPERIRRANVTAFADWLARERGRRFADYTALWRWSVEDLEGFWQALWDYFHIDSSAPHTRVLGRRAMPGAEWFPGARLNYAQHVLRREPSGGDVLLHVSESQPLTALTWEALGNRVRTLATELRALGVEPGDRVVAWMPNIPETLIAMLATTAIGAIWACCSPDFGERGTLDRLVQLSPKLLFGIDGYRYGGKAFDRRSELRRIAAGLTSLEHLIYLPYLSPEDTTLPVPSARHWRTLFDRPAVGAGQFEYAQVPFDHPLWTLFSSGTTGLPKPIVHGHGGILLETLKNATFHFDLHPRERVFYFTTTGWMLWNFLMSTPLCGAVPVLYDGHPSYPTPDVLWKMAQEAGVVTFGASPTYVDQLSRLRVVPRERFGLEALRTVNLAGSPASPECMGWFYRNVKADLWVANGSGGTDCCTGFVGGVPTLPVRAGEIQAPSLGVSVKAYNARGESVVDEVGELVITEPMPSMPLRFWNDPGDRRYLDSYFQEFPGVWRHGDFFKINPAGNCWVLGRSDATLNRYGVRIGTAEVYRSLGLIPDVQDALIVNLDLPGGGFFMPLFVKLAAGVELNPELEARIRDTLRREYTPRHVPDKIYQVPGIPYTLTGKKMEVPVRRILMGVPPEKAANRSGVSDPTALDFFIDYARRQQDYRRG
ncbi:MAG: acetoacetate--CoA ligase [Gammaproteobacteria bacterium]|nr:MAG: acetoacetate--CoA ligase [Gammaproteobacteria bacterium]TLZ01251.1 MAG: acetoacetate--CoA ligase [Gammaproteobacteria bacterium]